MTRVTLPAGHNGKLCDAQSAQAIFKSADVCKYGAAWWACIAVLSVVAAAVIVVGA